MRTATIDLDWLDGRISELDKEWLEEDRIIRKNQLLSQLVILNEIRAKIQPSSTPAPAIDCPVCGQPILLTFRHITMSYHGKDYDVDHWFYRCEKDDQEFTTTESDAKTLFQIPAYRETHEEEKAEKDSKARQL